ncbi:MAG TPA: inositol monophosphatase family protein [Candidatus Binatia bacterium]|nr:inositol monophosphatase family protein [Candidatus Binatia bacterium]
MTTPPDRTALDAIARRAGALALGHFRRVAVERKADRTVVTRADREVEALLTSELAAAFPEAGIQGEEGAARPAAGPYRFVIDPIDGTSSFVAGLPTWCVSIGLLKGHQPVAGVVHVPCSDEMYVADAAGAWWNGEPLPLLDDRPGHGDPFVLAHSAVHRRYEITWPGKLRSLGSTAYHAALVARGVARAALLGSAHIWDVAGAGALLARVGGRFEYLDGATVDLADLADGRRAPQPVLAGTSASLAELRAHLRRRP